MILNFNDPPQDQIQNFKMTTSKTQKTRKKKELNKLSKLFKTISLCKYRSFDIYLRYIHIGKFIRWNITKYEQNEYIYLTHSSSNAQRA